jgi:lipopolysaccharide heptosyltransferase II
VHVSRFSHSKAPVALALIGAMKALDLAAPGAELLLVGQGPEEQTVAAAAREANERLGRQAVTWLGGRSDVPRLLGLSSVVVGTASVALEAMASGKPVVAAGKGGYLGPVTADSLARAEQTCFADHEEVGPVTADRIAADLAAILTSGAAAVELGQFGRRTAEERYSVPRLGEQVETIYREALCPPQEVRSILIFHLNQIGDLMFTLPALKALREAFPQARITSLLRPHLIGLLAESGFVDEIIPRPPGGPLEAIALARRLRRLRPDLAIAFSQSATMAICARLSGARQRIGYIDSDLCRLLNHRVQERGIPCPRKVMHLLRSLGVTPRKTDYVGLVRLAEADEEAGARTLAGAGLAGSGPLVALAPGESADRPYKSWSMEGFTRVGERLAAELDARLIVVGGGKDAAVGDAIASGLHERARSLAGKTTPAQLAAVLSRCDLLIGIDSGPMHVAAALGVPVVGIFGPTDPTRTGPMGEGHEIMFHRQPCAPCMAPTCTDRPCMASISADEVAAAALRILARERGKSDIAASGG